MSIRIKRPTISDRFSCFLFAFFVFYNANSRQVLRDAFSQQFEDGINNIKLYFPSSNKKGCHAANTENSNSSIATSQQIEIGARFS